MILLCILYTDFIVDSRLLYFISSLSLKYNSKFLLLQARSAITGALGQTVNQRRNFDAKAWLHYIHKSYQTLSLHGKQPRMISSMLINLSFRTKLIRLGCYNRNGHKVIHKYI